MNATKLEPSPRRRCNRAACGSEAKCAAMRLGRLITPTAAPPPREDLVQYLEVPRSSEHPASIRGHWAMGRPPGHTGCQVGEPLLVRV